MNWECNRCGYRVQPINKKVKPDGMAWPAGSACSRCLNGEMVCHPIYETNKIQALRFAIDRIVTSLETETNV